MSSTSISITETAETSQSDAGGLDLVEIYPYDYLLLLTNLAYQTTATGLPERAPTPDPARSENNGVSKPLQISSFPAYWCMFERRRAHNAIIPRGYRYAGFLQVRWCLSGERYWHLHRRGLEPLITTEANVKIKLGVSDCYRPDLIYLFERIRTRAADHDSPLLAEEFAAAGTISILTETINNTLDTLDPVSSIIELVEGNDFVEEYRH